jgi:putative ABC transport system permease protein
MILAVTAVLVPVMLLLAIRSGVVGQMRSELTASPQAREMSTVGEPTVTPAMIEELRANPGVAFAVPRTRLLSAAAVMRTQDLQKGTDLDLVPSGQGDPVVRGQWQGNSVAVSENAARQLGIRTGAPVVLVVERRNAAGEAQQIRLPLKILDIVPAGQSRSNLAQAYLPYSTIEAVERWREDERQASLVQARAANQADARQRRYSGIRLYASSIDDVPAVRQLMQTYGLETASRAGDIRLVQRLERSMTIFVGSLAVLMALGLVVALGAIQWGWVERKRFDYSYLRLLGMERRQLFALPVAQAVLLVVPAIVLAFTVTLGAQAIINRLFAGQVGSLRGVSNLSLADSLLLTVIAFLVAMAGAFLAARNAARISPVVAIRGN